MKRKNHKIKATLTIWSLTFLLMAVTTFTANAQTVFGAPVSKNKLQSQFYQANDFYEKGQFQSAVDSYQKLLESGYESGNLYYNLGNAYFKLGNKGQAILYYEKARRLIPSDADLKANLAYAGANGATGDWKVELINTLAYLAPVNQLFTFTSVGFFLLSGLMIYLILFQSQVRTDENKLKGIWLGAMLTIGFLFAVSIALTTLTVIEHNQRQAVALQTDASVSEVA
jgi:tetratricopeptide (TPR) repeat protein